MSSYSVVLILILHIIGSIFRGVVQRIPLIGMGNRLLGALIGFIEAWLVWVVLLLVLHNFLQDIHSLPGGVTVSQINSWQQFYNDAVTNSLFAHVNSFIVARLPIHQ